MSDTAVVIKNIDYEAVPYDGHPFHAVLYGDTLRSVSAEYNPPWFSDTKVTTVYPKRYIYTVSVQGGRGGQGPNSLNRDPFTKQLSDLGATVVDITTDESKFYEPGLRRYELTLYMGFLENKDNPLLLLLSLLDDTAKNERAAATAAQKTLQKVVADDDKHLKAWEDMYARATTENNALIRQLHTLHQASVWQRLKRVFTGVPIPEQEDEE